MELTEEVSGTSASRNSTNLKNSSLLITKNSESMTVTELFFLIIH